MRIGNLLLWILLIFVLIQFVPVDRFNESVDSRSNFVDIYQSPSEIRELLENSCYDCHSNETIYPSYSLVAPVSWMIKDHINQGRRYLNYSEWGSYNKDIRKNIIEKSIKSIESGKMPLPSYVSFHPESRLTPSEIELLVDYFKTIETILQKE